MSGFGYRVSGGQVDRVAVKEALSCTADFVWVHLTTNEEDAQAWLRDAARLDDYVVDALTATETRPRCEAFEDGALLNLRGRSSEEMASGDPLASVRIWAIRGRVYSVSRRPLIGIAQVEKDVEKGDIVDPGDFIAAVATAITSDLDPHVADLGDELDDCEERLDANRIFDLRRAVTRVRVAAIGYRRFLAPQRAALEKLGALPGGWLADDDRRHLATAADRAARMVEELESIRERASLMHEALTDLRSEQIDSRSLVISIVAMVFLPLTFITGLYGMNVAHLPYAQEPWAFDAIMGLCGTITVGVIAYFVQQRWFSQ
ncbi:zinc transporter ZntB [Sphingomonas sp. A2-49]|uniref:zinc transporter ZntB n=1 Tax=Sphingomonas sp. A2-49 TaxID=1391375 RepID=UPI0021CE9380|nr:zinc transporter ZntB [Sphingomonas sp. A2-49]MCU6455080.1 zinc transporter ZntB [Sphingomonas sp. A2-49]